MKTSLGQTKKVSASTNPTDRVLKRQPDTFFRLRVRYFQVGAPACVANNLLRRRSRSQERSRKVKIKKRKGDLDCWPRLLSHDPGARRDVRHYSIDTMQFLSSAANRASFSLLATFNFKTDKPVFFIFLAASFSPSKSAVSCLRRCQWQYLSTSPRTRNLFAEDVFCTWTRMRVALFSLEITSLWIPRFPF